MVDRPEDYAWSSYVGYQSARAARGAATWLDWQTVLRERSKDVVAARRAYRKFVEQGIDDPPKSPLKSAVGGMFLGASGWVERMRERLAEEPQDLNVPDRKQLAWRPSSSQIIGAVLEHFNVDVSRLGEVRCHGNDARAAAIYLLRRLSDQSVSGLARQYGDVSVAAISKLIQRAESRRIEDPQWNRLLTRMEKQLATPQATKS